MWYGVLRNIYPLWVPAVTDHVPFLFWGKSMKWPSTALASNFPCLMSGTCTYAQHPKIQRWFTNGFLKWKVLYGVLFSDSVHVGSLFRISWVYCTTNGHKFLGKFDSCIMVLIISKIVLLRYSVTLFSCRVFAYVSRTIQSRSRVTRSGRELTTKVGNNLGLSSCTVPWSAVVCVVAYFRRTELLPGV